MRCKGRLASCKQTNLQQLFDDVVSVWTKLSEECFDHFLNVYHKQLNNAEGKREPNPVLAGSN